MEKNGLFLFFILSYDDATFSRSMIDSSLEQSLTDKFLRELTLSSVFIRASTIPSGSERLSSVDQRFKLAGVIALNLTTDGKCVCVCMIYLIGRYLIR